MRRRDFSWTQITEWVNEILRTNLLTPEALRHLVRYRQLFKDETLARRLAVFVSAASSAGAGDKLEIDFDSWVAMALSVVAAKGEAFIYRRVDDALWKLYDFNPVTEEAQRHSGVDGFLFQYRDASLHHNMNKDVRDHVEFKLERLDIGLEVNPGISPEVMAKRSNLHIEVVKKSTYNFELGRLFSK